MTARIRLLALAPLFLAVAACGSDDDSGDATADDVATVENSTESVDESDAGSDDTSPASGDTGSDDDTAEETGSDGAVAAPSDGSAATLTLANGEVFEFSGLLCTLEPQMAGGSEILFTAVSYGDPGLDVTQFGDEGTITGVATISVYNGAYETLWEASTFYGSSAELTLDGSTIRGTGSFLQGEELTGDPVDGELVANC